MIPFDGSTTTVAPRAETAAPAADASRSTALAPAADAARRERLRQVERAGRSGPAAIVAMGLRSLRRAGSAEAAEAGLRYQPIIWSVIAVVALAFFLPGRPDGSSAVDVAGAVVPTVPVQQVAPASPAPVTPADPAGPSTSPITFAPSPRPASPATTVVAAPRRESPSSTSTTVAIVVPLSVRGHGWAGTTGSIGSTTPAGAMPVGARLGSTDKVSFLRLSGTGTVLALDEDPAAASEPLGAAVVKLCTIAEDDWSETEGQNLSDAPTWTDDCVSGVESSGRWTFDLSGLGDPTARTGFALVPGDSAPADFQIAFVR